LDVIRAFPLVEQELAQVLSCHISFYLILFTFRYKYDGSLLYDTV
jgi:hypothetical protein